MEEEDCYDRDGDDDWEDDVDDHHWNGPSPLAIYTDISVDMQHMQSLEEQIASMAPNMAAIEEFRRKVETYLARVQELSQVTTILSEQRKLMDDAKSKRLSEFMDGFHAITSKLKEMYQMITQGQSFIGC